MKKFLSLLLALGMTLSLAACGGSNASSNSGDSSGDASGSSAPTTKLRFVTGGESGTYYAFGSVIAQHATNNTNVAVTGLVGNGSKSNVEELADGNAELAFCQSDVMAYAYNGTNLFENPIDCFSTVAALYMEDVQIVTTDPSIKTVADMPVRTSPWAPPAPACISTPWISSALTVWAIWTPKASSPRSMPPIRASVTAPTL